MGTKQQDARERLREKMRWYVNDQRAHADEMAAQHSCDDPLHPYGQQVFMSWLDFVERVARPLVEADGDEDATQEAMALYRKASPYFICTSLVMAANRADSGEV